MAAPLTLSKIDATSDLAISNIKGKVNRHKIPFEAWSSVVAAEE